MKARDLDRLMAMSVQMNLGLSDYSGFLERAPVGSNRGRSHGDSSIRDDLNFQRAENVRFFTNVTVVFLPLGFAVAIFSIGGAPPRTPLIGMTVTAVVVLILTVIALVYAQALDEAIFMLEYRALGKFKPKSGDVRNKQRSLFVDEHWAYQ